MNGAPFFSLPACPRPVSKPDKKASQNHSAKIINPAEVPALRPQSDSARDLGTCLLYIIQGLGTLGTSSRTFSATVSGAPHHHSKQAPHVTSHMFKLLIASCHVHCRRTKRARSSSSSLQRRRTNAEIFILLIKTLTRLHDTRELLVHDTALIRNATSCRTSATNILITK